MEDMNRQRLFADVISIDAWHEKFSNEQAVVDLHADVVFATARVGGEAQSQVRFRLGIKRAELVMIIHGLEPFGVDKTTVARFGEKKTVSRSFEEETDARGSVEGTAKLTASLSRLSSNVGAKLFGKVQRTRKEKLKWTDKPASINVTFRYYNAENSYRWTFRSEIAAVLEGRPWDALKSPLLKLVDRRSNRRKGIAPTVRLQLQCLREDLDICGIELKNSNMLLNVSANRLRAAEAYIRNRIEEMGLEAGNISDKFTKITLADVFANNGRVG